MRASISLFTAVLMTISLSTWAADTPVNPKLEQAKQLRAQSLQLQMQADMLLQQAKELEIAVLTAGQKPGEKMRDLSKVCAVNCISNSIGNFAQCTDACGCTL